ncbi:MAG: hypothetical protein ACXU6Q_10330 [Croceibacterium sp.]
MIRTPLLAALTLLVAAPSLPQSAARPVPVAEARAYRPIETIRWTYNEETHPGGSSRQLRFKHDKSNSNVDPRSDPDVQRVIDAIAQAAPGQDMSFYLNQEAGTLACSGHATGNGEGVGTCRFDPDNGFAAGLARRGIGPDDSDDLLALTLVNAHMANVDALTGDGFHFDNSGELIAVLALGVSPTYVSDLRQAGLRVDKLGDLIAAKALKVDGQWLGEMAQAGYPDPAIGKAIQMRALGVTPDYAMKMARVLHTVGEIQ